MAIDTENKRRSVLNMLFPFLLLPEPDSTIDSGDRQHVGEIYRGIPAQTVATAGGAYTRILHGARRRS